MLPHPTVRNECPVMFSTVMWPESSPPALTVLVVSTRLADRDGWFSHHCCHSQQAKGRTPAPQRLGQNGQTPFSMCLARRAINRSLMPPVIERDSSASWSSPMVPDCPSLPANWGGSARRRCAEHLEAGLEMFDRDVISALGSEVVRSTFRSIIRSGLSRRIMSRSPLSTYPKDRDVANDARLS